MLRAVGLTEDDWDKPQIGIANSWNEITPCNMTLRTLAEHVKAGVREAGRVALEFGTITVSDGISMGHEGMRGLARQPRGDLRLGRDRGVRRAPRRVRRPGRLRQVDAGDADGVGPPRPGRACSSTTARSCPASTTAGRSTSRACSRPSAPCAAGTISEDELLEIERKACPGEGACGGMFTANTMSSIGEAHRHEPARARRRRRPSTPAATATPGRRRGGRAHARARDHAAPDHDQAGVRERHRPHLGPRRLDQRGAAPAGHRQRGRRRARPRRLQPRSPPVCPTSPT